MCSKLLDHCTAIVCSIKVAREFSLRFLAYIWSWAHPCILSIDGPGLRPLGNGKPAIAWAIVQGASNR